MRIKNKMGPTIHPCLVIGEWGVGVTHEYLVDEASLEEAVIAGFSQPILQQLQYPHPLLWRQSDAWSVGRQGNWRFLPCYIYSNENWSFVLGWFEDHILLSWSIKAHAPTHACTHTPMHTFQSIICSMWAHIIIQLIIKIRIGFCSASVVRLKCYIKLQWCKEMWKRGWKVSCHGWMHVSE